MSAAPRKARKRAGERFVRVPKEVTPVLSRQENVPRDINYPGQVRSTRFGLPSKAARRLKARGVERPGMDDVTPEVES